MGNEASKKLTPKQMDDLKEQTAFTGPEIRDWFKRFHCGCPSGLMTHEQFRQMYEALFPRGDSASFSEHVFKVYDKDKNGVIDFQEFVVTVSVASRGAIDDKLRWAFSLYDLDNNGYLSKQEVEEICKAIFRMRGQLGVQQNLTPLKAAEQLFANLDKNGDDRLSATEFIVGAKSSPEILSILESRQAVE